MMLIGPINCAQFDFSLFSQFISLQQIGKVCGCVAVVFVFFAFSAWHSRTARHPTCKSSALTIPKGFPMRIDLNQNEKWSVDSKNECVRSSSGCTVCTCYCIVSAQELCTTSRGCPFKTEFLICRWRKTMPVWAANLLIGLPAPRLPALAFMCIELMYQTNPAALFLTCTSFLYPYTHLFLLVISSFAQ